MAEPAKYLYCIVKCQEDRTFQVAGIGDSAATVHTVCWDGLAAVVSDSPTDHYESTRKNMMAHETVLEAVMSEFTLLTVRFGTITDTTSPIQDIHKLLRGRHDEFQELLADMEDKVELGVKAYWRNERSIYEEILEETPEIRRLRSTLAGRPQAALRYEGIELGRMVKEALDRKRAREASMILQRIRSIATLVRENETRADRMIVNAALLVEKRREHDVDLAVAQLDAEMGNRVAFKYVGPVPPYNFVNVYVNWLDLG